jgi:hypothetical protein
VSDRVFYNSKISVRRRHIRTIFEDFSCTDQKLSEESALCRSPLPTITDQHYRLHMSEILAIIQSYFNYILLNHTCTIQQAMIMFIVIFIFIICCITSNCIWIYISLRIFYRNKKDKI